MPSNRIGRINEEIQRELSDQLRRLKDPRVSATGMVSITRVDTTGDLRYARIYVSTLDKARETEVLQCIADDSIAHGAHMLEVLRKVEQEDESRGSEETEEGSC